MTFWDSSEEKAWDPTVESIEEMLQDYDGLAKRVGFDHILERLVVLATEHRRRTRKVHSPWPKILPRPTRDLASFLTSIAMPVYAREEGNLTKIGFITESINDLTKKYDPKVRWWETEGLYLTKEINDDVYSKMSLVYCAILDKNGWPDVRVGPQCDYMLDPWLIQPESGDSFRLIYSDPTLLPLENESVCLYFNVPSGRSRIYSCASPRPTSSSVNRIVNFTNKIGAVYVPREVGTSIPSFLKWRQDLLSVHEQEGLGREGDKVEALMLKRWDWRSSLDWADPGWFDRILSHGKTRP